MENGSKPTNSFEKQVLQLPVPEPAAQQHSIRLIDSIVAQMQVSGGVMDFARFMEAVLTTPQLGYYTSGNQKFGHSGDFVTAPEISTFYSRCLARQCAPILADLAHQGEASILEFGAGTGVMAADILLELQNQGVLPVSYYILELSAELKLRQRETLQRKTPQLLDRVHWLDRLPEPGFRGVILANEVLDAMPVHRFYKKGSELGEYYVTWNGDRFDWQLGPFSQTSLADRVMAIAPLLPEEYSSEVNLAAEAWIGTLADLLQQGVALIIDYGFPRHEFYHPQRATGTLMCHYRHRSHSDPFLYPGLQDVTAHLDFTALAEAAHDAGLHVAGFASQASFLLAMGLEQFLQDVDTDHPDYFKYTQQVKTLTMPSEMGELFKVMAVCKGYDKPLQGFQLQDRRSSL